MIAFAYGTTGELIKLAPVLRRLEDRGAPLLRLCTAQQAGQILPMLSDFGLSAPDVWLGHGYRGEDLERPRHIPRWLGEVSVNFARHRRKLASQIRSGEGRPLVVVHGDTMTTVLGAVIGQLLRVPVAHIEAGMRSGDWRNPFPEELNRKLAARLTRIHFAPGPGSVANLTAERVRGEIIDTAHNTISDNLGDIPAELPPGIDVPAEPFGLVSLHRQELLYNEDGLRAVLQVLRESADRGVRLLFVDHPITAAAVESAGLSSLFDGERLVRIPRQRYFHFLSLLKKSVFLVTDSGGSQEECAFMGHPCLIHRTATEHATGLGGSVVLSRGDLATVREFLDDPERLRSEPIRLPESPSDRIVRCLEERGFLPERERALSAHTGNDAAGGSSVADEATSEHIEQ